MAFGSSEVRRIKFEFDADTSGARRELGQLEGSVTRASKSSEIMTGALRRIGPMALDMGLDLARSAANWAFDGIEMAETAQVIAGSFDTTFGPAAQGLREDMDELRLAMGLSEVEFQGMATNLGQVATGTGQTREEAALFSAELITMAGDIAAFNGDVGESEGVLNKMAAALRGEFDPLEAVGVVLKQADVNQRAMSNSGKTLESDLTALEKQMATLELITESLGDESGALAEQFGSTAVKANEAEARLEDLQAEAGEALIPLKEMWVDLQLKLIPALSDLGGALNTVGGFLADIDNLFTGAGAAARGFADRVSDAGRRAIGSRIGDLTDRFRGSLPSFHSGGRVPGATGSLQPAMLQGGETVRSASQSRSTGSGGAPLIMNVHIDAGVAGDPQEIGRHLVDLIGEFTRQSGPADISIRGGSGS